jgi:hypothetical protein
VESWQRDKTTTGRLPGSHAQPADKMGAPNSHGMDRARPARQPDYNGTHGRTSQYTDLRGPVPGWSSAWPAIAPHQRLHSGHGVVYDL